MLTVRRIHERKKAILQYCFIAQQPFLVYLYVRSHYKIDKHIKYTKEPIAQKWNGIAQHVAAVILDGTDTIVLTLFATLSDVSIYSVYYLVVKGVKQLFLSMTNGMARKASRPSMSIW